MDSYLLCEDDGLFLRQAGDWAVEKLDYVARYLNIFTTSMRPGSGQHWRALNFIDLFSGPGKCQVRKTKEVILGSPLISLLLQFPFTNYFFNDMDQASVEALNARCSQSPFFNSIRFFNEDANQIVSEVVKEINDMDRKFIRGEWPTLNLAFLDPEGLELHWKTVETLAKVQKMDLIIYYSQMGLKRNVLNQYMNQKESIIDIFFGTTEWRDILAKNAAGEEMFINHALLNLYSKRLENLGYKEVHIEDSPLIRSKDKNAPLYRLIFASKNPLGNKFWKEVVKRDVYGQPKLC